MKSDTWVACQVSAFLLRSSVPIFTPAAKPCVAHLLRSRSYLWAWSVSAWRPRYCFLLLGDSISRSFFSRV